MEILTAKDLIEGVPVRWAAQYRDYRDRGDGFDKAPKTKALLALKPGFTKEQVDAIIGNTYWTSFCCSNCSTLVDKVVSFDVNCGEYSYNLCLPCVEKARKLLRKVADD